MRRPVILYRDFARLNEVSSPEHLRDDELQEAINAVYDEAGGVSKRTGIETVVDYDEPDSPITRLIDYSKKEQLLVAYGTTLRVMGGEVIKDDFDNTDFGWEIFSDGKLYLVNGKGFYVYDGETLEEVSPPGEDEEGENSGEENGNGDDDPLAHIRRCKYIVQRGERLFAAGDDENPNTIYFSEVGAPNDFPPLNFINAVSDDNDIITGLSEFHQAMVAFKRNHIYAWFGWDPAEDVRFDKINVHTGTASARTIQRVYNFLFYLGEDGVYALHGLEASYISSNNLTDEVIKRRFGKLTSKDRACSIFHDGKYILSVSENGKHNDLVLVFDFVRKAWSVWTGWDVSDFVYYNEALYMGSGQEAMIYKEHDEYNDDGEVIPFRMKTKPFDCQYPMHEKKFAWFHLLIGEKDDSNEIDVTVECDYKSIQLHNGIDLNTVMVPGAFMFDGETPEGRSRLFYKRARILARSLRTQVTIENNELNEGITIYGVGFQYWPIRV